jgi:hypothetical protein
MLHGFELGLLSEEDRQAFEEHLLDCDHCYELAKHFLPTSLLLRHDPDLRADGISDEASSKTALPDGDKAETKIGWFNLTRTLSIAALIIVLAIPVYWFGFRDAAAPDVTQRLVFTSVRGGTPALLYADKSGVVELVFARDSLVVDLEYHVIVSSRDGASVLYENARFSDFDSLGAGSVSLPLSDFIPGFYVLFVTPRSEHPELSKRQYNFRVK